MTKICFKIINNSWHLKSKYKTRRASDVKTQPDAPKQFYYLLTNTQKVFPHFQKTQTLNFKNIVFFMLVMCYPIVRAYPEMIVCLKCESLNNFHKHLL